MANWFISVKKGVAAILDSLWAASGPVLVTGLVAIGGTTLGLISSTFDTSDSVQLKKARVLRSECFKAFQAGQTQFAHLRCGQSAEKLQELADNGNSDAKFEIAKLYCVGWGVAKIPDLSAHYFKNAELDYVKIRRILVIPTLRNCFNRHV